MAFSTGANGSGNGGNGPRFGRFRNAAGGGTLSEINVVPLVDIVLVLLIIFMLTAHVMEFGLEIDVPKVKQTRDTTQELPVVSITRDGDLYLNNKPVNINLVGDEVRKRFGGAKSVYLRADKGTTWDPIAQVIGALGDAHLGVNVVTQPEDQAARRH